MTRLYSNNFVTDLDGSITNSDTTITLTDATGLPSIGSGDTCFLTIDDGTNIEIVEATAVSGNDVTVTRAKEGTSAQSFADEVTVELRATANSFAVDAIDDDIVPDADSTRDIGLTGTRWANIYVDSVTVTNNITTGGTVDGRNIASDGSKLDGIESNADVTDETNVTSSLDGATLTAVTVTGTDKVLAQDADDSDNLKTVTAQSIADLGSGSLSDLSDGNVTTPSAGEILIYDNTNSYFENSAIIEGEGINLTLGDGSITIDCEDATSSNKGIASFDATDFTVTSGDVTVNAERVQDIVGAMLSGNTETNITVTYQDGDGTIDFAVDDSYLLNTGDTGTGSYDFGGADDFEIPNGAAPTVDTDGQIAIDTSVTDFSAGVFKFYSGEEMAVIAVPIAQLTSPTDGHIISYNATNDEFELVAEQSGIDSVVEDTTPQLGGDLDTNGNNIQFNDANGVDDNSGNEQLIFSKTASAVNHYQLANAATGNAPVISAVGDDTNIDVDVQPKGTGNITIGNYTFDGDQAVGASQDNFVLRYDNSSGLISLESGGGGLSNVVEDTTPQLGGDLDANAFDIQFDDGTGIRDDSDNEQLIFSKTASAVNYMQISNASAGNDPSLSALGDDTNINLDINSKGTGNVNITANALTLSSGSTSAGEIVFFEDSDNGTNYLAFAAPSAVTSTTSFTLPDGDGTNGQVIQTDGSGALSFTDNNSVTQATQSAIEAETDEDTYIPPDLVKHVPGVAKSWCKFSTKTSTASDATHNISSLTDNGTGDTDLNFSVNLSSVDYVVTSDFEQNGDGATYYTEYTPNVDSLRVLTRAISDDTLTDVDEIHIGIFGDH